MKKFFISLLYLILQPRRAVQIFRLYRLLKGRYRITIILAHSYREAFYRKKQIAKNNLFKISKFHKKEIFSEQQVIINIHDGLLHSGGLTDRLKGICTLYNYAKKHNYSFKLYFVFPFNLEKYLLPSTYNWQIEESQIFYNLNSTAIYTWENEKFVEDFFRLNKNKKQLHISCNSAECYNNYSELFHQLFKPSPLVTNKLKLHIEKLGGSENYISISLRFQNLLDEFVEGTSISLDIEKRHLLIEKCLNEINTIKCKYVNIDKILITSDSNIFREIASKTYSYVYTYILPEEVGHIDYADVGKGKELTAFLDMFLIAHAKKAYQVRSEVMYNSDFPRMAAQINKIPYEIIII